MPLETVSVLVQTDDITPIPVDGVVVRVFDTTGATLITEGITGTVTPGLADFTLDGDDPPIQYRLRFSILGGTIVSPQSIQVYSPPDAAPPPTGNAFEVEALLFELSPAPSAHQCRASGILLGAGGRPRSGIDIHFINMHDPLVVDGFAVLGERESTRSDASGRVQIDLIRGACYLALVQGVEDTQREVTVPDRSSINIAHLLFPIVAKVEYDLAPGWSVAVDETLTVVPTVTDSSFRVLPGTALEDVIYTVEDPTVARVSVSGDELVITGVSPGTTDLVVTRKDESIVYDPDPGIDGGTAQITVV